MKKTTLPTAALEDSGSESGPKEETEETIVLRSIFDVNLPKFLAQDIVLFKFVIKDIFPAVELVESENEELTKAIRAVCSPVQMNLQVD